METDTKMLIACSCVLACVVILEILRFSWIKMLLIASVGLLTAKYAKDVVDNHTVNHAIIGFVKEDGQERPKILKQWHGIEIKKDDRDLEHAESRSNDEIQESDVDDKTIED